MDYENLECSYRGGPSRTAFYYAHPYRSSERGSNEQANGMIRRFFLKGIDLSQVSKQEIKNVQNWMNNYPRKILGVLTAHILIQKELGEDFVFH
ncbi:MAG: IS30 family transposase [Bacteroidetes bacterium]|nr:IS30 family transposase [Bacteroidota bacterium]